MEYVNIGQFLLSLVLVVAMILACAWIAKRVGVDRAFAQQRSSKERLQVVDRLMIDPRRRLVLIRRDGREHLLLLGMNQDLVIESYDAPAETHTD